MHPHMGAIRVHRPRDSNPREASPRETSPRTPKPAAQSQIPIQRPQIRLKVVPLHVCARACPANQPTTPINQINQSINRPIATRLNSCAPDHSTRRDCSSMI